MSDSITLRKPVPTDGPFLHRLISQCPPLDTNSLYCNLLHCSHFAETSVAAVRDGDLLGFVSGYVVPGRPDTLFIWQVAVSGQARGTGLASNMLKHILDREDLSGIRFLETTITPTNDASWALFTKFAKNCHANLAAQPYFDEEAHFAGQHDSERLVRIGPFKSISGGY